jgi:hypothetical protein
VFSVAQYRAGIGAIAMVTIKFKTENDAFSPYPEHEIVRILRKLAENIETRGPEDMPVIDVNGNRVGQLTIK